MIFHRETIHKTFHFLFKIADFLLASLTSSSSAAACGKNIVSERKIVISITCMLVYI